MKPLTPRAITNIKHNPTPSQIHINTHPPSKDLFISVPISSYIKIGLPQNIMRHAKKQKETVEETKQSLRTRLRYDTDVGIIRGGI